MKAIKINPDVVDKDDNNPEGVLSCTLHDGGWFPHIAQNLGRTEYKHCTYHHQKENRKYQHDLLRRIAQIATDDLWLIGTPMAHRQHTREVIVN